MMQSRGWIGRRNSGPKKTTKRLRQSVPAGRSVLLEKGAGWLVVQAQAALD